MLKLEIRQYLTCLIMFYQAEKGSLQPTISPSLRKNHMTTKYYKGRIVKNHMWKSRDRARSCRKLLNAPSMTLLAIILWLSRWQVIRRHVIRTDWRHRNVSVYQSVGRVGNIGRSSDTGLKSIWKKCFDYNLITLIRYHFFKVLYIYYSILFYVEFAEYVVLLTIIYVSVCIAR